MPKVARKQSYKALLELPPLSADECEGLRSSIAASGVIQPIVVWPKGKTKYIIDGNHRRKIAAELGYDCPEILRSDLDEEEARIMARALNLARRQLDREQKRQIIADQLHESPERSARWIAKMLGVDHKTVISVRDELRSGGEIPHLDSVVGRDGKCYSLPANHERYTPSVLIDAVRQVFGQHRPRSGLKQGGQQSRQGQIILHETDQWIEEVLARSGVPQSALRPLAVLDRQVRSGDQGWPCEAGHCRWPCEHRRLSSLVQAKRPIADSR
jgi:hypothetical protein